MGSIRNKVIKKLTATGAVSTNNTSGYLYEVIASATTAAAAVEIKDGATGKIKFWIAANGLVHLDFNEKPLLFATDIDCTITSTGTESVTFVYAEVAPV